MFKNIDNLRINYKIKLGFYHVKNLFLPVRLLPLAVKTYGTLRQTIYSNSIYRLYLFTCQF